MQFILMHRTDAYWESGAVPDSALVARVGAMIGELVRAGAFVAGEGLGASSRGASLRGRGASRTRTPGPFHASEGVPAGFALLQVGSLDDAMAWAAKLGAIFDEGDIEVRPVNEPWDIGVAPKPEGLTSTRFMALFKDPAAERGEARSPAKAAALAGLFDEMRAAGVLVGDVALQPSARGARLRRAGTGYAVTDGPFAEAKELVGGYAIVKAASKAEAIDMALRYVEAVGPDELDVREIAEPG
jgi:hypothetical protein